MSFRKDWPHYIINPLSPHDALKHHFTSFENRFDFPPTKGFRRKINMKLFYQYKTIFLPFLHTSSHLHSLQGENCDSNSRLVVDEDDNDEFRLERVNNHQPLKRWNTLDQLASMSFRKDWPHYIINPLSHHDVLKHHFTSLENRFDFPTTKGFRRKINMKLFYQYKTIFFTHFKSSSFTTSRELRQQFAACSGWRWQW